MHRPKKFRIRRLDTQLVWMKRRSPHPGLGSTLIQMGSGLLELTLSHMLNLCSPDLHSGGRPGRPFRMRTGTREDQATRFARTFSSITSKAWSAAASASRSKSMSTIGSTWISTSALKSRPAGDCSDVTLTLSERMRCRSKAESTYSRAAFSPARQISSISFLERSGGKPVTLSRGGCPSGDLLHYRLAEFFQLLL